MPRFFITDFDKNHPVIMGQDAVHITKSLRMKPGDTLTVCDAAGMDYTCRITGIGTSDKTDTVNLSIEETKPSASEPSVKVTLFQCLPKGDKLETVTQKAVELGVYSIVPVLSERCISRPDQKSLIKKRQRLQKIANEAAGQSGRGILPHIEDVISFKECAARLSEYDCALLFYEAGGSALTSMLGEAVPRTAAILIGPEGGFAPAEAALAEQNGAKTVHLGPRILRTETAPVTALSCIMLLTGNLE